MIDEGEAEEELEVAVEGEAMVVSQMHRRPS